VANITLAVPAAQVARVEAAFAFQYGYQATLPDEANPGQSLPNPETKSQFVKRMMAEHLRSVVKAYEVGLAQQQAGATAGAGIDTDLGGI
jgi:hypothetical protein